MQGRDQIRFIQAFEPLAESDSDRPISMLVVRCEYSFIGGVMAREELPMPVRLALPQFGAHSVSMRQAL
jgi:hypothetical protein